MDNKQSSNDEDIRVIHELTEEDRDRNSGKEYRPNVAAVIMSQEYPDECRIFIAKRAGLPDAWQFPQGGIDKGEDVETALFRELREEIGTDDIEIVARFPGWITYDFPPSIAEKMRPFDGQRQKYFLVRLKSEHIDIHTQQPEFSEYKFVDSDKVFDYISYFKRPIYRKVLNYFKKESYL
jgi:putative (di)nucleoside polyphosphate hydrolase